MASSANLSKPGDEAQPRKFCAAIVQGAVLALDDLPIVNDSDVSTRTELGVAVISQTCDIVNLNNKPNLVVCRIVKLADQRLAEAKSGSQSRYASLSWNGEDAYADLHVVGSISKTAASKLEVIHRGPDRLREQRTFALAISRAFGRFPFPDEVSEWLRPLEKIVRAKYLRPTSVLGQALHDIYELRVYSPDWNAVPCEVVLQVIFAPSVLPQLDDDDTESSNDQLSWLRPSGELIKSAGEIADRLYGGASGQAVTALDRWTLLEAFAEALAAACIPEKNARSNPRIASAISGGRVTAEVWDSDEYSISNYRDSETLDIQDLSGSDR